MRSIFASRKGNLTLKHASEEPRYTLNGIYIDRSARFKISKVTRKPKHEESDKKKDISIQIYNQKCKLLFHRFPTKSTA